MTDERRDNEIREELERAKAAPRRPLRLRRFLPPLLLALAVLGAVAFAATRNVESMDSLRRMLSYNKARQGADGRTELFRFDSDRSATYRLLGGKLLIVSTARASLLGEDGGELWSRSVNFTNPAVAVGGRTAAVYDVGGKELYIVGARGLVREMGDACGNGILSVSINGSDYLALTTLKSGCRAAVSVYAPSGEPVFTFNSSERYISDACVLSDNRRLAAVTLGETNGVFACTLSFYAFDSEQALSTVTLDGSTPLSLRGFGGALALLGDDRLTVFSADGSLLGTYRYPYPYLRGESSGSPDFAVLLLSRYRSGSTLRCVTVNAEGDVLGTLDARREILDVSAAGRYIAVLYSGSLTIYTADFTEYATLPDTDFARQVVMRDDGSAVLLGASRAWLYSP